MGQRRQVMFRLAPGVVKRLDEMAKDLGLTRQQLLERLIGAALDFSGQVDQAGLFDAFAPLLEGAVKAAVDRELALRAPMGPSVVAGQERARRKGKA